ncbi:hypothetical protein J9303_01685 [Bacillaceae bacterium Marseille-Q3522]|nr:hypothetical protein [Bacillaceae bacterium Marseille-Q3522]
MQLRQINKYRRIKEGLNVTDRSQFGIDIDAACGQLYANYHSKKCSYTKEGLSCQ